jgi:hypothetical protein
MAEAVEEFREGKDAGVEVEEVRWALGMALRR